MDGLSLQQIKAFQNKIFTWYSEYQRDLPWREVPFDTSLGARDPYKILVSEIMLQQTQVSRVIPKYEAWLVAFPTVHALAVAPISEVLKHWSGLGYNRRALNLKKTAQIIDEQYGEKFPRTEKELLTLPGIGQYTARAVMCFAFNQQVSVVDINVKKVILTQLVHQSQSKNQELRLGDASSVIQHDKLTDKEIAQIADQLLPRGKAYAWNQALMDYASLMLKKEKIDIPKQSIFKGSRRYYRGQILKQLLDKKEILMYDLGPLIKAGYLDKDTKWLKGLVEEMQKEGFITLNKNVVMLTS
ncbi:MAG: A/G-specific adenine glycosylase [Candidatus Levybacteria bacterium]|nr:A/G-specific adenine glycosylase [Candidatus Levybacteria bacterium]